MRRTFSFATDEYYHIYNRGTDKRIIFLDSHDYNRFIVLLHLCNSKDPVDIDKLLRGGQTFPDLIDLEIKERLVDIGAYCLMPNHFHILVKEINENGISVFMKKLATAYSMYFNKKYNRTGGLFEGSFKAKHVNEDSYLKYLFAYINLNPIKLVDPKWKENGIEDKVKAEKYLLNYRYSSYLDFLNIKRKENKILNNETFPQYFQESKQFMDFINDWIDYFELDSGKDGPSQN
jgi:putative transposase